MAKRQFRLLHGWKLAKAVQERAKKIVWRQMIYHQIAAKFLLASAKNDDWCLGRSVGAIKLLT
jgi:hypothetical protein